MGPKTSAGKIRRTYEFIKANRHRLDVQTMCRVLEVAPSSYYAWLQEPVCQRALEDIRLLRLIRASFAASPGIYEAPRVFLDLREVGETCSKHRVMRLVRVKKIRAARGYRTRHSSTSKPSELIPNGLQRNFDVASPNKPLVTDITYIRSWQGWLYLAVVMDLLSRKIVGWSPRPPIAR
jgi:putative transposase